MKRTVITGIGVVAPGGTSRKAFWNLLTDGRTATRRISMFDPTNFRSQIAAECDFDPLQAGLSRRDVFRNDRFVQFALAAANEAVADSGLELDGDEQGRVGVSIGSAVGSTTRLENEYVNVSNSGSDWVVDPAYATTFLQHALVPSSAATELASRFGTHGPATVVSTGCTSGIDALGHAHQLIQDGDADIVIAGASDAPISPISVACFDAIRATSSRNDEAATASRPFDARRDGFVIGEGSAVLILEEFESAQRRGASIYAEITGYASYCNAFHMTGLRPDGLEMSHAIDSVLDQAQINATSVDYINAHGSGTRQNDRHETAAFKRSLGAHAYQVPVSSIKSMVGHSLGAIGSIEVAACALAIEQNVVPPTANYEVPDPECDLDYVPKVARDTSVNTVLSVGSGFGGFQSAILLQSIGGKR